MNVAFITGALASGLTGAALSALVIWVLTVVTGSEDPWRIAPLIVAMVSAAFAILTYVAERFIYRRSQERKRATGEPWAYRED
jgi:branched-subunit amino acid ABC-type transport system permease component